MTETPLSPGDEAPDFDLTSTEDVLLMLRDEVPRTSLVLYVFLEVDDETRGDLGKIAQRVRGWAEDGIRALAMAPVKVAELKQLQAELELPFPLLEDDRDFCSRYGVSEDGRPRRLLLVDRQARIHWASGDWSGIDQALADLKNSRPEKQSRLINYPGSVVNKLVAWWTS